MTQTTIALSGPCRTRDASRSPPGLIPGPRRDPPDVQLLQSVESGWDVRFMTNVVKTGDKRHTQSSTSPGFAVHNAASSSARSGPSPGRECLAGAADTFARSQGETPGDGGSVAGLVPGTKEGFPDHVTECPRHDTSDSARRPGSWPFSLDSGGRGGGFCGPGDGQSDGGEEDD